MKPADFKGILLWMVVLVFGLLGTRCAATKEESKTFPKDYVHPLSEINLEKVFTQNRGLKILEENATKVDDYYRGGVQEKEEGETLLKENKWEEARKHLEKSNRFLLVVLKYLREDEAYRMVYEGQTVIFLPNLLIADNALKLVPVYRNLKNPDIAAQTLAEGQRYLAESEKSVKTEWAIQLKKGFEDESSRK